MNKSKGLLSGGAIGGSWRILETPGGSWRLLEAPGSSQAGGPPDLFTKHLDRVFSLRWIGEARMAGGTHRDRSRRAPKNRLKPRRDRYFNMNLNNKCVCEVCSGSIRRNWKHAKIHNCDTCNFHSLSREVLNTLKSQLLVKSRALQMRQLRHLALQI